MLESFWKPKKTYRFFLKSGATFDIKCDDVTITWEKSTGQVTQYEIEGIVGARPLYITPPDISAVVRL